MSSNGTWYFWDGYLDEIGYWNRALSSNEIKNLSHLSQNIHPQRRVSPVIHIQYKSNTIIEATGIVSRNWF